MCVSGVRFVSFSEKLTYVLSELSLAQNIMLYVLNCYLETVRDHLFNTYANFLEKILLLTHMTIRGVFRTLSSTTELFANIVNNTGLDKFNICVH